MYNLFIKSKGGTLKNLDLDFWNTVLQDTFTAVKYRLVDFFVSVANTLGSGKYGLLLGVLCALFVVPDLSKAAGIDDTTQTDEGKLDLYLDCDYCYRNYIKQNITFVNYTRNRRDADVQLMLTRAQTGGGGREFTLYFYGRGRYSGQNDTLTYFSPETDTRDVRREGLVKHIKIGLMSFVATTPLADRIDISYKKPEDTGDKRAKGRWNKWMFELGSHFSADGQESSKSVSYYGSARAERITEAWKIRFNLNTDLEWEWFEFDRRPDTTIKEKSYRYNSLIAKSLTKHWSLGLYSNVSRSTFDNMDFQASISPAIEYNIYPYSEYNSREISFRYRITPRYNNYRSETIFFKYDEFLFRQVATVRMEYTQPWGEVRMRFLGANYLHDFDDKYRLSLNGSVEIQVVKGLTVDLFGNYSFIHDQLSVPRGGASYEEVLLDLRQRVTSYSFYGRVGISYSFGAIYNNIVNPRF